MKKLTCVFSSTHDHSEKTLKAFQEFIFSNLNCAMMQCIHVSLEAAIEQWKIMKATPENPSPKPNLEQFDNLCKHTKACDKVSKFLAIYSGVWHTQIGVWLHQRRKQGKCTVERFCRCNVSLLQTNRKHHLETFSILIKYSKRWWNVYHML